MALKFLELSGFVLHTNTKASAAGARAKWIVSPNVAGVMERLRSASAAIERFMRENERTSSSSHNTNEPTGIYASIRSQQQGNTTVTTTATSKNNTTASASARRTKNVTRMRTNTVIEYAPFAGLVNLGATCYLNSLLQVLFHNGKFRRLVFKLPPALGGISFALQELFLTMSERHLEAKNAKKESKENKDNKNKKDVVE